jgi:hypothetical protein
MGWMGGADSVFTVLPIPPFPPFLPFPPYTAGLSTLPGIAASAA